MNFQKLKYAVVAAESGSFREAARKLFVAQSSLSTAIKELEAEYQVQIFERTKKGIFVTEKGSEFLGYAKDILSQIEVLEQRYLEPIERKLFSVSSQHYDFASDAFARLLKSIDETNIDYRLLETSTDRVLQDVKTAYSELGIIFQNNNNKKILDQHLRRYEMEFQPLGEFQPHIFVGLHHPLAERDSVHLEELAKYPTVRFEQTAGSSTKFSEESLDPSFENQTIIYITDRAASINLISATNSYLIGTGTVTSQFENHVKTIPIKNQRPNVVGYIKVRYRPLSSTATKFIEVIQNILSKE